MLMFLLNRNHTNGVRHFKYVSNQKVASIVGRHPVGFVVA